MDPRQAQIILVEAADRALPTFAPHLSMRAADALGALGVRLCRECRVVRVESGAVYVQRAGQVEPARIAAQTVPGAAGVQASSLAGRLAEASGASTDRQGRIRVNDDLTVPGHPEIFAVRRHGLRCSVPMVVNCQASHRLPSSRGPMWPT